MRQRLIINPFRVTLIVSQTAVPIITTIAITSVNEDQPYTYIANADDPDSDTDEILRYSLYKPTLPEDQFCKK